ncbi:glycerophosphoryl diester phosphodiesterase [Nocardiopsis sp. Huas11]|uniref:glycerophosphodiester phosphodiesterase n=1 Tax=Nocardiopsis sp. Huas11 TaxID=2183912 RepID=UPI000EAEE261|nr:glycerophosphodiester phosphodiesterase family protein [Nocardiopsis sp. Huas11]RKS10238.1 glycerophosphoryl diester phosphodiesterase [Nocardiopsis sp. Huas11]
MHRIGIVGAVSFIAVASATTALATPTVHPQTTAAGARFAAEHPGPVRSLDAVAHRGASAYAPENTLAAIDEAAARGAVTAEIDVQLTADDELVIMHDATLTRTTDVEERFPGRAPYDVADFTMDEIRELDAGSWFDDSFEGEPVPTLGEALDRLEEHDLNLFLELKQPALYPGMEELVADEITDRRHWMRRNPPWQPRRLVVQSFDWRVTERSKELMPSVPHALLGRVAEDRLDEFGWADLINPNHTTIDAEYVDLLHESGFEIMPYTINDRARMDAVLEMGVDGFITDHPDIGRAAIDDFSGDRNPRAPIVVPPARPAA